MRPLLAPGLVAVALTAGCGALGAGADTAVPAASARAEVAAFRCPEDVGAEPGRRVPVGRRLRVVTTVAPLTSLVAAVAGPDAVVRGLVPEGQDSHTFEPAPSLAESLEEADVVVLNGLRLEEPTAALARRRAPGRIVALGDLVLAPSSRLYDRSFPRSGGAPNPHLWTNPPMAGCYALVIGRVLAAADPDRADGYRARAHRLADRIDGLDAAMRHAAASVPARHRALLTYHDAYAYTAAHYGWRVIGAIQPSSFDDPSPRDVARLIEQVRRAGVPAIFGSEVFPSPVLARIGQEAGVRYVDTLRDDDLPGRPGDPEHSYLGLMRANFTTIVRRLGGDPGPLLALDVAPEGPDRAIYPR